MTNHAGYQDLLYDENKGVATITINRPEKHNAFRGVTCDELIDAFNRAGWNKDVGVIVFTGAGTKAFCTGGDQSAHEGSYDGRGTIGLPMEALHAIIRIVPKPVIAKVRGYAIGGGNVLATLCDLTIASESAQLGQVGPKVGSVDPGFGTAYLARIVGDKRAREIWYMCRRYSAREALAMGLINYVVPKEQLLAKARELAGKLAENGPLAVRKIKEGVQRTSGLPLDQALAIESEVSLAVLMSKDAREGPRAFKEKRKPNFTGE